MKDDDKSEQARTFEVLMRRSGLEVPAELWAGTFAGYLELCELTRLLRQPRGAESEPATGFDVVATIKSRR
jgi:hypothetical protein